MFLISNVFLGGCVFILSGRRAVLFPGFCAHILSKVSVFVLIMVSICIFNRLFAYLFPTVCLCFLDYVFVISRLVCLCFQHGVFMYSGCMFWSSGWCVYVFRFYVYVFRLYVHVSRVVCSCF